MESSPLALLAGISSSRLRLRPFERRDFEGIRSWVNNPEVTSGLVDAAIFSHEHPPAETMAFLESSLAIDPANIRLVVSDTATGAYLGQIALFGFDAAALECELDIVLANPRLYDRGLGAEAAALAAHFAFTRLGMASVIARIVAANPRALRCFQKAGFALCMEESDDLIIKLRRSVRASSSPAPQSAS